LAAGVVGVGVGVRGGAVAVYDAVVARMERRGEGMTVY
jgi:hypothetical protein